MSETYQAWRPGVLVAGAIHPDCSEWSIPFMSLFIDDVAKGLHPHMPTDQLVSVAAMRQAALEAERIIRELTQ